MDGSWLLHWRKLWLWVVMEAALTWTTIYIDTASWAPDDASTPDCRLWPWNCNFTGLLRCAVVAWRACADPPLPLLPTPPLPPAAGCPLLQLYQLCWYPSTPPAWWPTPCSTFTSCGGPTAAWQHCPTHRQDWGNGGWGWAVGGRAGGRASDDRRVTVAHSHLHATYPAPPPPLSLQYRMGNLVIRLQVGPRRACGWPRADWGGGGGGGCTPREQGLNCPACPPSRCAPPRPRARYQGSRRALCPHVSTLQTRLRVLAISFFMLCVVSYTFVEIGGCNSYILSWLGYLVGRGTRGGGVLAGRAGQAGGAVMRRRSKCVLLVALV